MRSASSYLTLKKLLSIGRLHFHLPSLPVSTGSQQLSYGAVQEPSFRRPRVYLMNQYKEPSVEFEIAVAALRAYSVFQRPETVEIVLRCNMKYKKDKLRQPFRGNVIFPHSFGNQQRVLVFAEESLAQDALDAGADIVGGQELLDKVSEGMEEFDVCLSTPTMFKEVKKLQSILRAKMPAVRRGTVVEEFVEPIQRLKNSREYHSDKKGYVISPVAKLDYPIEEILANIKSLTTEVLTHRQKIPAKTFIETATLSSTYGPGFLVNVQEIIDPV